jgi:hypothetical protein
LKGDLTAVPIEHHPVNLLKKHFEFTFPYLFHQRVLNSYIALQALLVMTSIRPAIHTGTEELNTLLTGLAIWDLRQSFEQNATKS